MAFMDRVGEKNAIAKLNSQIKEEERVMQNAYIAIGKIYADLHRADFEEAFAAELAVIFSCEEKIEGYHCKIMETRGLIRCNECGAEVAKDHVYCPQCGKPLPKPGKSTLKCSACGETVNEDTNFCPKCGTKIVPPVPEKVCAVCGTQIKEGNLFCTNCGHKFAEVKQEPGQETKKQPVRACVKCGYLIRDGMNFCDHCGEPVKTEVEAEDPTAESVQITGEKVCPKCGKPVAADMRFCAACGTEVASEEKESLSFPNRICSKCGAKVEAENDFCTECGTRYQEIPAAQPTSKQPAEKLKTCPLCGAKIDAGNLFCTECGTML